MEDDKKYNYLFKVVLIGDASVGKTCLVRRYAKGFFVGCPGPTIGVDFMVKNVDIDGEIVKLQLWDTAGQERFRSLTHSYYKNANAVVIVYDITNTKSFDNLQSWLDDVDRYCKKDAIKVLVGNKKDLNDLRQVDFEDAKAIGSLSDIITIETSAKDDDNVNILFNSIASELKRNVKGTECNGNSPVIPENEGTISIGNHHSIGKVPYSLSCCRL